jgi:cobalt/nickel transport system ATP-binding protein
MAAPLISLNEVSFAYPGAELLLDSISLTVHAGERLAIVGDNGAGKTTLLRLIVGLCKPTQGRIVAFGRERRREPDFREVRVRAGLLFQDPDDQLFCPTVLEDVAFGPLNLGRSTAEAKRIAARTLADVGLDGFGPRLTHALSGGEKRLVTLAAVLAMQPDVLLLDEPSNALDGKASERLIDHLTALPQALLVVSHDRALIDRLGCRVVVLRDGRIAPAPPSAQVAATPAEGVSEA